jgi:hypothetical protein
MGLVLPNFLDNVGNEGGNLIGLPPGVGGECLQNLELLPKELKESLGLVLNVQHLQISVEELDVVLVLPLPLTTPGTPPRL